MAQTYQDLRGVELVKQDSAKYLYRRRKLLQKLDNKKKFTLVKGGTVIFDTWPKDIQAILYGKYPQNTKEADNIILTSNRLGNFSLRDLKKTKEFGGGGTRGSTADTKTTENLQCVYLVAKYEGKTYDEIDLRKVKFSGDLTTIQTLDKWQKLSNPEEWHLSSMAIADAIHSEFGGSGWTFRRGDSWVKDIYALYNKFNKDAKFIFSQSDKWNPADIWMTKGAPMPGKEDSVTDILTLNLWLENQYTLKTIIPISLKQHIGSGPVKLERKNQRFWLPSDYKFDVILLVKETTINQNILQFILIMIKEKK